MIYLQLAIKALPLPAFHDLDLAMIHLISSSQPIQLGVRYKSFVLSSFLMGYINGVLRHGIKDIKYDEVPSNLVLSNAAYQTYKHQQSAARSFQVLPSSDTTLLVTTTTQVTEHIVSLPPITLDRLQGSCSCRKYDDFSAPCSYTVACI
jgi:hypothetical protein